MEDDEALQKQRMNEFVHPWTANSDGRQVRIVRFVGAFHACHCNNATSRFTTAHNRSQMKWRLQEIRTFRKKKCGKDVKVRHRKKFKKWIYTAPSLIKSSASMPQSKKSRWVATKQTNSISIRKLYKNNGGMTQPKHKYSWVASL